MAQYVQAIYVITLVMVITQKILCSQAYIFVICEGIVVFHLPLYVFCYSTQCAKVIDSSICY